MENEPTKKPFRHAETLINRIITRCSNYDIRSANRAEKRVCFIVPIWVGTGWMTTARGMYSMVDAIKLVQEGAEDSLEDLAINSITEAVDIMVTYVNDDEKTV